MKHAADDPSSGGPADIDVIFSTGVMPFLLGDPAPAAGRPQVHFCGGPPGSGKSVLVRLIRNSLEKAHHTGVTEVVGDDMRAYLPEYARLLAIDDQHAAEMTDEDTGRLVEKAIDWSIERSTHTVVEGTFRRFSTIEQTAEKYRLHNFDVVGHVIASCPMINRFQIIQRYVGSIRAVGTGRYTVPAAHNRAFDAQMDTLRDIFEHRTLDTMVIYNGVQDRQAEHGVTPEDWPTVEHEIVTLRACRPDELSQMLPKLDSLEEELRFFRRDAVVADLLALRNDAESLLRTAN